MLLSHTPAVRAACTYLAVQGWHPLAIAAPIPTNVCACAVSPAGLDPFLNQNLSWFYWPDDGAPKLDTPPRRKSPTPSLVLANGTALESAKDSARVVAAQVAVAQSDEKSNVSSGARVRAGPSVSEQDSAVAFLCGKRRG